MPPPMNFTPVTEHIQNWIDKGYYPNGASILIARNGRTIYSKDFGGHTHETVEYIASAGKWLAAAAILAVVDEGDLTLDDSASKWIPEFGPEKGSATIRQMLSHTSGYLPYQPEGNPPDQYQTLEEAVAQIVPLELEATPGTRWNYGGLAMQIAGRMAEIATGKPWETIFQEQLARPLGMTETHFTPVDPGIGHAPMLGGGARSTLHDYTCFLSMLYNEGIFDGHRVLSEKSIEEMLADQVKGAELKPDTFVTKMRQSSHSGVYGLGVWRELEHASGRALLLSSPSWAGAYPWLDKKRHLYGVFIAHVGGESASQDHFNAMEASAALPILVGEVIDASQKARPGSNSLFPASSNTSDAVNGSSATT